MPLHQPNSRSARFSSGLNSAIGSRQARSKSRIVLLIDRADLMPRYIISWIAANVSDENSLQPIGTHRYRQATIPAQPVPISLRFTTKNPFLSKPKISCYPHVTRCKLLFLLRRRLPSKQNVPGSSPGGRAILNEGPRRRDPSFYISA